MATSVGPEPDVADAQPTPEEPPAEPAPPPGAASSPPASDPAPSAPPEDDPPEEGAPAWMMTFGDMMSLLLTFFILLFSMSEIKVEKFRLAAESFREGFGDSMGELLPGEPIVGGVESDNPVSVQSAMEAAVDAELDSIAARLEEFVETNNLEENVVVTRDASGVYLRIQDVAVFASGSADIQQQSIQVIEQLGEIVIATDVPVVISGHTDDIPIRQGGKYDSNWELSAARAAGVARALVDRGHNPADVTVEAYGEYRPITSNDTPEGRGRNRRVELFYSRQKVEETLRQFRNEDGTVAGEPADSTVSVESPEPPAN